MSNRFFFRAFAAIFGLTSIVVFQNCSDINLVESTNRLSLSCDPSVYNISREAQTSNGNTVYFVGQNNQDISHEYRDAIRWFINGVEQTENVIHQNRLLLNCENHPLTLNIQARLKTDCGEEIEIQEAYAAPDTCEEAPEPPTCEEDPTQPHCEEPVTCGSVPDVFDLTVKEFDAPVNEGGFGGQFDSTGGWVPMRLKNILSKTDPIDAYLVPLSLAQVKSWSFTVSENKRGNFYITPQTPTGYIMSISKGCPAKFTVSDGIGVQCRSVTVNGPGINWSSDGSNSGCNLEPGETYYLNMAFTALNALNQTPPTYLNTCGGMCFLGEPCNTPCSVSGECTCQVVFSRNVTSP